MFTVHRILTHCVRLPVSHSILRPGLTLSCPPRPFLLPAAALLVKRQEQQDWQQKVDVVSAGDLPRYIEVGHCAALRQYRLQKQG